MTGFGRVFTDGAPPTRGHSMPIHGEAGAHLVEVHPDFAEACPTCRTTHCWFVARALPEPGRYRIQCVSCDGADVRRAA